MNKYNNGKIYLLVCNTTGKRYYGSTIQSLEKRLRQHENAYNYIFKHGSQPFYCSSFPIFEHNNYKILIIEHYPCKSCRELIRKEKEYIQNNECINKQFKSTYQ